MSITRDPLPVLEEMPDHVLQNIIYYSGVAGRLSLLRVNRRIHDLVQTVPFNFECVEILYGIDREQVSIKEDVDYITSYESTPEGCKTMFLHGTIRNGLKRHLVRDVDFCTLLASQLKFLFGSPKTTTRELYVDLAFQDVPENRLDLNKLCDVFARFGHQINARKFSCSSKPEQLLRLLSFMKPDFLKLIDIDLPTIGFDYLDADRLVDTDQFKKAEHFKISGHVYIGLESLYGFKTVKVSAQTGDFDINWLPQLRDHLFNSPTFERYNLTFFSDPEADADKMRDILHEPGFYSERPMPDGGTFVTKIFGRNIVFKRRRRRRRAQPVLPEDNEN